MESCINMTKTSLLKLTDNEMDILSDTFEQEIMFEYEQGNDETVKYYTKLNDKLGKSNRFTQEEIGTFCKLSFEQSNHYWTSKLGNEFESLYQKTNKLLEDLLEKHLEGGTAGEIQ